MRVEFSEIAWDQYAYWQDQNNKKILKKIRELIKSSCRTPSNGVGKPERLKGEWDGYWSRRIDQKHRFVYKVYGEGEHQRLVIARCKEHY